MGCVVRLLRIAVMKSIRLVVWFGAFVAVGCGKGEPPAVVTEATVIDVPAPATTTQPTPVTPDPTPVDPYQIDPAKHAMPSTPTAGRLDGKPFAPTVTFSGGELAFRKLPMAAGETESSIVFKLPVGTTKLIVKPDQPAGEAVPRIDSFTMSGNQPILQSYLNGYGLTLELGVANQGKVEGKLVLALPDTGKSYLSGTFTAEVLRQPGELPGSDDVPYLQGSIALTGDRTGEIEVGRIAAPAGSISVENVSLGLEGTGPRLARAESPRPSAVVLTAGNELRFEHTRLTPGRYLIWAKLKTGAAAWTWVTVAADTKADLAMTIDPKAQGSAKVTLPKDVTGVVRLLPADDDAKAEPIPETALAFALKLEAAPNAGIAAFPVVPAGDYRVIVTKPGEALAFLSDKLTIAAGKEATLTLKAKE